MTISISSVSGETLGSTLDKNTEDSIQFNVSSLINNHDKNGKNTNPAKSDRARARRGWSENKEPRMFDAAIEEEGCKRIMEQLTEEEIDAMPDDNMPLRHFRADKGNVEKAVKRIKYAIQWRKDFGVEKILQAATSTNSDDDDNELKEIKKILMHESSPGKMYVRNHDNAKRAILYMFPVRENTNHPTHNIMHLVYSIERAIACTEKNGLEKIVMIMDFKDWKMKHAAPLSTTKQTIHILQDCYVERLERAYITNAPLIFRTFWNMVKPFLDPVTKAKIVFCSSKSGMNELKSNFDVEKVETCALGTGDLKGFDVDEYFQTPFDMTFDEK